MKGLFVTGTDTGVGKTVAAAALMHRYRGVAPLRYWKPIQTGIEIDDDTATVRRLGACCRRRRFSTKACVCRNRFRRIWRRAGRDSGSTWRNCAGSLPDDNDTTWIVEGAGGLLVPINETQTMADWIAYLALPVLVVARSGLGTINHTLLTLEALRARSLRVAGVMMIGEPNADNRAAIEQYGRVPVVAEMPFLTPLDPGLLAAWSVTHLQELLEFLR